jgi:hypothetical protein
VNTAALRERVSAKRAELAELLGRSDRRGDVAVACAQCGRDDTTVVYRLSRRSGRYWCRDCGAVAAVPDLAALVPARWTEPVVRVAPPAPVVLAPAVAEWYAATTRKPLAAFDKAAYYQLHKRFDAATGSGLPSVSSVVGQLHESCYLADPVVAAVAGTADVAAVRDRVVYARAWLASAARDACWLLARYQPDVAPPAEDVARAGAALADGSLSREDAALLRQALFGTDGGPQLKLLLRGFTDADVTAAIAGYCSSGARPLRDRAVTALQERP